MLRRDFLTATSLSLGLALPSGRPLAGSPSLRSILDFGARPDGKTLNTRFIQRAIDEVFQGGGGLVYVPPGVFLTGGLELRSRVTLYLEAGSKLLGSTSMADYAYRPGPSEWGDANGHHLLFACDADDVSVCGLGTIDGQGAAFWHRNLRPAVPVEDLWKDAASFDWSPNDRRPSPMLEFAKCRNLRLSGITLKNSPGWTLRPIACETVVIDAIRIRNPAIGPNTDGIDITACSNVMVSNCDIDTGDDAICLKSQNPYGDLLPTRNITVTNCILRTECNGFKLGTATFGAYENIVFSNSVIYNEESEPLNFRATGGISIETVDGGSIDGVSISNIRMQNVRTPLFLRLGDRTAKPGSFLRNISVQGIDASGIALTSSITGIPGLRPSDITVADCRFRSVEGGKAAYAALSIPEVHDHYPESRMMGRLPASGLYVRHADRVRLRNLEFVADRREGRPAVVCDDVTDIVLNSIEATAPQDGSPVIDLRNTRRAAISNMRLPDGASTFASIRGASSAQIEFFGNSRSINSNAVRYEDGASAL